MTTSWIDIADTAVKIGLGALISGLTSYYLTRLKFDKEAKNEIQIRKLNTIEEIAKHVDAYLTALLSLISDANGIYLQDPDKTLLNLNTREDIELMEYILDYDNKFVNTREQKNFASSKLHLLGLTEVTNSLHILDDLEHEIRTIIIFDRKIPDSHETEAWSIKISLIKTEFFRSISPHYNI